MKENTKKQIPFCLLYLIFQIYLPNQFFVIAKLYVDKLVGKPVPKYFDRLTLKGDGLLEKAFK